MLLIEAAMGLKGVVPKVYMDSGVENLNTQVDALVASGTIRCIIAQVDVVFSNSMIESWWRILKHGWLYLNTLESIDDVRKHTTFYVYQHNRFVPHSTFKGQTPDEMHFGKGIDIPNQLDDARTIARQARLATNRAVSCSKVCTHRLPCTDRKQTQRDRIGDWSPGHKQIRFVGTAVSLSAHWPQNSHVRSVIEQKPRWKER